MTTKAQKFKKIGIKFAFPIKSNINTTDNGTGK